MALNNGNVMDGFFIIHNKTLTVLMTPAAQKINQLIPQCAGTFKDTHTLHSKLTKGFF